MEYNRVYLINYNKFLTYDNDKLFDIVFYSTNILLKDIAIKVLINDNRLLDSDLNYLKLYRLVDLLTIDQLAYLSNFDDYYPVALLSKMKILSMYEMSFSKKDSDNILYLSKK